MKKIWIVLSAFAVIVVFSASGSAEQWSFFSPSKNIEDAPALRLDTAGNSTKGISSDPIGVFAGSGFASLVPLQVNQLVLSLLDVKSDKTGGSGLKSASSQFQINTGIRSENYLSRFESQLMDELFSTGETAPVSAVVFVGLGLELDDAYIRGSAFLGRPQELVGMLYGTQNQLGLGGEGLKTGAKGFNASGGYQINNRVALGAGFGKMTEKNKETDSTEEVYAVYAQAVLGLAPGIQMIPEVGQVERKEETPEVKKEDDSFYAGAKWEINF